MMTGPEKRGRSQGRSAKSETPAGSFDHPEILEHIVTEGLRVLAADRAALFLWQPESNALRVEASVGLSQSYLDAVSKNWKKLPVGRTRRKPKLCFWPDATMASQFKAIQAEIESEGFRSIIIAPLLSAGGCQGWLAFYFDQVRDLSDEDKSTAQTFAYMAAIAIENAETREKLDSFFRGATDAILTENLDGIITSWNPSAESLYGYKSEEAVGKSLFEVISTPLQSFTEWKNRLVAGEIMAPFDTVRRRKDGSQVDVSVTVSPIRNAKGRVVGLSGIHTDIGRRKAADESLRASEVKYRTVFEDAHDAIALVDKEGCIVDCNEHLCELHGYTREEMIGKSVRGFVPGGVREKGAKRLARMFLERRIPPFETKCLRKDGVIRDLEVSATPIQIEGHTHAIYFIRDITEQKQATEERFRQLAENIREIFWLTETDGFPLYVSPVFEEIWGLKCESYYENPEILNESIHPEDRERVIQALARQVRGDYDEECRITRPDGSVHWIRDRAFPIRNEDGEVYRIARIADDITERKWLEEQLRQSQKIEALGRVASGMAHDFNNTLGVILGFAQMSNLDTRDPKIQHGLDMIEKAALGGAQTVKRLQDFARKREDRPSGFCNLNDVIAETVEMTRPRWKDEAEKNAVSVEVVVNLRAQRASIRGEKSELHEIFINLVYNALEALPDGGCITLSTDDSPEGIIVRVSDTGKGMTADELDRAFEPYFSTKGPQGNGLGLSMVYGIVKRYGGRITLESTPGVGTLAWISHPPLGGWIFECDLEYFFLSGALAVEPRPVDGWS